MCAEVTSTAKMGKRISLLPACWEQLAGPPVQAITELPHKDCPLHYQHRDIG